MVAPSCGLQHKFQGSPDQNIALTSLRKTNKKQSSWSPTRFACKTMENVLFSPGSSETPRSWWGGDRTSVLSVCMISDADASDSSKRGIRKTRAASMNPRLTLVFFRGKTKLVLGPSHQPDILDGLRADVRQPQAHLAALAVRKHEAAVVDECRSQPLRRVLDVNAEVDVGRIYRALALDRRVVQAAPARGQRLARGQQRQQVVGYCCNEERARAACTHGERDLSRVKSAGEGCATCAGELTMHVSLAPMTTSATTSAVTTSTDTAASGSCSSRTTSVKLLRFTSTLSGLCRTSSIQKTSAMDSSALPRFKQQQRLTDRSRPPCPSLRASPCRRHRHYGPARTCASAPPAPPRCRRRRPPSHPPCAGGTWCGHRRSGVGSGQRRRSGRPTSP
jgi:hypothetical protein